MTNKTRKSCQICRHKHVIDKMKQTSWPMYHFGSRYMGGFKCIGCPCAGTKDTTSKPADKGHQTK